MLHQPAGIRPRGLLLSLLPRQSFRRSCSPDPRRTSRYSQLPQALDAMKLCFCLMALVLAACANTAAACSCTVRSDKLEDQIQDSYGFATSVVQAEAIEVKTSIYDAPSKAFPGHVERRNEEQVTWRISRIWKGTYQASSAIKTITNTACCVCGFSVRKGAVYVLYLIGSAPFSLSACSPNKSLNQAHSDVEILSRLAADSGT